MELTAASPFLSGSGAARLPSPVAARRQLIWNVGRFEVTMACEESTKKSVMDRAAARIPPWPPQEPTSDGGDFRIAVVFSEHREANGEAKGDERLAVVTFNPRQSRHKHEHLSPRGVPPLFATLYYASDTGGITIMVLQSERDLLTVSSPGPADTYTTVRLSNETSLSILVHRNTKV